MSPSAVTATWLVSLLLLSPLLSALCPDPLIASHVTQSTSRQPSSDQQGPLRARCARALCPALSGGPFAPQAHSPPGLCLSSEIQTTYVLFLVVCRYLLREARQLPASTLCLNAAPPPPNPGTLCRCSHLLSLRTPVMCSLAAFLLPPEYMLLYAYTYVRLLDMLDSLLLSYSSLND